MSSGVLRTLIAGFGRCVVYKSQKAVLKGYPGGQNDRMMGPTIDSDSRRPIHKHKQLDFDGLCHAGARLVNKQVRCVRFDSSFL